jgi:hypothetical protein
MRLATERDREIIVDENRWPLWPRLPLKRPEHRDRSGLPELGFLVSQARQGPHTVFLGMVTEKADGLKTMEYKTINDLLDDGWVVD